MLELKLDRLSLIWKALKHKKLYRLKESLEIMKLKTEKWFYCHWLNRKKLHKILTSVNSIENRQSWTVETENEKKLL